MRIYDVEMVEMIMIAKPEMFVAVEKEVWAIKTEQTPFGYIDNKVKEKITVSEAENILDTAKAMEMKYGKERAITYIKNTLEPRKNINRRSK